MNSISDTRNPTSSMLNVLYKDLKCVGGYFILFYFILWECERLLVLIIVQISLILICKNLFSFLKNLEFGFRVHHWEVICFNYSTNLSYLNI